MTEGSAQGGAGIAAGRQRALVLAATVLASAMAFIDGTVVTIALPAIGADLGADLQDLQWVVNAYMLMLGALILIGGSLGDRVGRKRVFIIGIILFAAASLACALARGPGFLIAARALQGVGAALLVPQSLAIISATYPREVRGRAIGVWAAASAITTALGPPLGGFLIDLSNWRVAFWINLPLSAAALWLSYCYIAESREGPDAGQIDWIGSGLAILSLGMLTYGLTLLTDAAASLGITAALIGCGSAGLLLLWWAEHRVADPIIPPELFHSRDFLVANVVTLFLYGALTGVLFLLPFDLIERRGMAASAVGFTMLPFGLIIGLLSRPAGRLADEYGPRLLLVGGSLLVAAATAVLALNLSRYWLGVLAPVVVMGLGMAAVVTPLTTTVMNAAPDARSGAASGVNNAASRVAGLIAVALLGAVAALVFAWSGAPPDARFVDLPDPAAPARLGAEQAFMAAYSAAMGAAAAMSLFAAVAAYLWLTRPTLARATIADNPRSTRLT
jgi:EmrB/QacA subfamily drug resistance transporter